MNSFNENIKIKINDTYCTWQYRGEGNSNLVIAIPEKRMILRIVKKPSSRTVKSIIQFMNYLKVYLGVYANQISVVEISAEDISKIKEKTFYLRPAERLHKTLQAGDAIITNDCTFLPRFNVNSNTPTFCIELKLKQGWIPPPDRKLLVCAFCLKQNLKMNAKLTEIRSEYCPLDMFSGNVTRMRAALEHLIDNPQNNLKIFKNGLSIFPNNDIDFKNVITDIFSNSKDINTLENQFYDLIIEILLKNYQNCKDQCENHLPKGSVLSVLYSLQKINELGMEEVLTLYKKYENETTKYCDILSLKQFCSDEKDYNAFKNYLIFSAIRDCSIMISFEEIKEVTEFTEEVRLNSGITFDTSVKITDLDPKFFVTIEKHWKQSQKALQIYEKTLCKKKCNYEI